MDSVLELAVMIWAALVLFIPLGEKKLLTRSSAHFAAQWLGYTISLSLLQLDSDYSSSFHAKDVLFEIWNQKISL